MSPPEPAKTTAVLSSCTVWGGLQVSQERTIRAPPRYVAVRVVVMGGSWLVLTCGAHVVFVASVGGWSPNSFLKDFFQRPRPDVVPHLRDVMSQSFPSGHALTSAVVYLTLGALLMRISDRPAERHYWIGVAMFATVLVGLSRLYLGVHYPTDVLAGWIIGLCWALVCWTLERTLERRAGLKQEQETAAS